MEIYINPANRDHLSPLYNSQIESHNTSIASQSSDGDNTYADSGFDLYIPKNMDDCEGKWTIPANSTVKIPLAVKMVSCNSGGFNFNQRPRTFPYYIFARSSISKTPLRLANNQGIIDAGYRGELMIALDNIQSKDYKLNHGVRLVQVCQPTLSPFKVMMSDKDFDITQRGADGFGSTGF